MIWGEVNAKGEAVLSAVIHGPTGKSLECGAILDTGFNGMLTLPAVNIEELGLPWRQCGTTVLANGCIEPVDIYRAVMEWNGERRAITVGSAETEPLLGMQLLEGHEVRIEVVRGGVVSIRPLT